MSIDPMSVAAARVEAEREVLVLKKHQDVAKAVAQSMVDLVKAAPAPAAGTGRIIDTYA